MSATEPPSKELLLSYNRFAVHRLVWSLICQQLNINYAQFTGCSRLFCHLIEQVEFQLIQFLFFLHLSILLSLFIYSSSCSTVFEPIKPWSEVLTIQFLEHWHQSVNAM